MSETDTLGIPVFDAESDAGADYSLEMVSELTGLSLQTIAHYREIGLLSAPFGSIPPAFTDESVRTLRRIEHLRSVFDLNDAALKLALGLMNEVEQMHDALRARR